MPEITHPDEHNALTWCRLQLIAGTLGADVIGDLNLNTLYKTYEGGGETWCGVQGKERLGVVCRERRDLVWCAGKGETWCGVQGKERLGVVCRERRDLVWCAGKGETWCGVQGKERLGVVCRERRDLVWCAGKGETWCGVQVHIHVQWALNYLTTSVLHKMCWINQVTDELRQILTT